jgi:hypothetical protein
MLKFFSVLCSRLAYVYMCVCIYIYIYISVRVCVCVRVCLCSRYFRTVFCWRTVEYPRASAIRKILVQKQFAQACLCRVPPRNGTVCSTVRSSSHQCEPHSCKQYKKHSCQNLLDRGLFTISLIAPYIVLISVITWHVTDRIKSQTPGNKLFLPREFYDKKRNITERVKDLKNYQWFVSQQLYSLKNIY